jgi:ribosomal protein L37E
MNSNQPARYIKARMGNDLKQKILIQNGIITEADVLKPSPTVANCARCQLVNPLENKYCSSCGYPLSVAAYEELKASENAEMNKVKAELQILKSSQEKYADEYEDIRRLHREMEENAIAMRKQLNEILRPRGLKAFCGGLVDINANEEDLLSEHESRRRATTIEDIENPNLG